MSKNDSGNKVYTILAFVFAGEKRAHEVASEVKWDTRAAADEMGTNLARSAYTPIIYEMKDYSVAIFNRRFELGASCINWWSTSAASCR